MEKKNGKTMKGLPISERPYEKVLEKGPVSLSDAELLSVILRSGTKNIPVRDMAEEILNAGNPPGLAGLLHGTVEDYKEIPVSSGASSMFCLLARSALCSDRSKIYE